MVQIELSGVENQRSQRGFRENWKCPNKRAPSLSLAKLSSQAHTTPLLILVFLIQDPCLWAMCVLLLQRILKQNCQDNFDGPKIVFIHHNTRCSSIAGILPKAGTVKTITLSISRFQTWIKGALNNGINHSWINL